MVTELAEVFADDFIARSAQRLWHGGHGVFLTKCLLRFYTTERKVVIVVTELVEVSSRSFVYATTSLRQPQC